VIIRAVKRLSSAILTGPNVLLMRKSWPMEPRSPLVQVALWLRARREREQRWVTQVVQTVLRSELYQKFLFAKDFQG
jgi:hypothetical protein